MAIPGDPEWTSTTHGGDRALEPIVIAAAIKLANYSTQLDSTALRPFASLYNNKTWVSYQLAFRQLRYHVRIK